MKTLRYRSFPVFEATMIAALVVIGWAAFRLYQTVPKFDRGEYQLSQVRDEYFEMESVVQTNVMELHEAFTDFLEAKDPANKLRFEHASQRFDEWMGEKRRLWNDLHSGTAPHDQAHPAPDRSSIHPGAIKEGLLPLLEEIRDAYKNYLRAARFILKNPDDPQVKERQEIAQRARARLGGLGHQARMRAEAMELVLAASEKQVGSLQVRVRQLRFGLLLALVVLCWLVVTVVYRRKMAETRAIIRHQTDRQLEQQAKLDKLAHFGHVAQELAHEVKQPLTAINARLYTLQKSLIAGTDAQKDAAVIRSEIKRLDQKVKEFLQLARPAEPKLEPLSAKEALGEIRDLMASQLEQESIELKYECEDDLYFLADLPQLKQVLINLVKNAAESLNEGGRISLRAKKERRELKGELTEAVVIEVEDNGTGIPPEIQPKIFDPFFSTKADGTGLGLAIAARMIDKHDGSLEFDSEPGKGTVFRIVLPACPMEQIA